VEAMHRLLTDGGDPNGRPKGGELSVLELAASNPAAALTKLLLKAGAKATPAAVCRATMHGAVESLKLLLAAGGNPNAQMRFGRAVIYRSTLELLNMSGQEPALRRKKLELLLKAGADVNRRIGGSLPATLMVYDETYGPRVFALTNAATRASIIQKACLPHGTPDDMRRDLVDLARLFLGKGGFAKKRKQVEEAVSEVLNKQPGAQLRYKRLIGAK
jgi:hypothetical protein